MQRITQLIHPDLASMDGVILRRKAARGIVLRDERILLLYTERYDDFSFPGGGVDPDEDIHAGLRRELEEETGARDVTVQQDYGFIEEYRPHWKPEYDLMHMISHFFVCDIAAELAEVRMESYEVANGMRPLWMGLDEAIAHNQAVMDSRARSMGQSIQRETFMLQYVRNDQNVNGSVRSKATRQSARAAV